MLRWPTQRLKVRFPLPLGEGQGEGIALAMRSLMINAELDSPLRRVQFSKCFEG